MNVLLISLDLFSFGGIQRYNRYLLSALGSLPAVAGVSAASLARPGGAGFPEPLRVDAIGPSRGPLRKLRFVLSVCRLALRVRPGLIIVDHINLAPVAFACAHLLRRPYVLNVYAIEVWGELSFLRRHALLHADGIVSDCEFTARYLRQRYPSIAGRITVILDCVDVERFTPPGGDATPVRAPVILTVSRLAPGRSKGHEAVMTALALLRSRGIDATYCIAGDGPDRARLETAAHALGLSDAVTFQGSIADGALPDAYRSCDIFALVSGFQLDGRAQGEGVPLVVLEAQACGKPVVTSARDGCAESIIDGVTGILVDPADPQAIAAALGRLLTDAALRQRMGAAARTLAERQFSVPIFESRIAAVIDDLAPAPGSVARASVRAES